MSKKNKAASANDLSESLPTAPEDTDAEGPSGEELDDTRTEQPAKPGMPGSVNDSRRCHATAHRTGERCKAPAVKGTSPGVCRVHGGAAPQVKKAAKDRLLQLVDPALAALQRVLTNPDTDDTVKVRAALGILDRTGFRPGVVVEVEPGDKWSQVLDGALITDDRSLGGGDDYEGRKAAALQTAYDAREESWREIRAEDDDAYEAGRIRPDEHTIGGVVVGRFDVKPDLGPTDPPRSWDVDATEEDR